MKRFNLTVTILVMVLICSALSAQAKDMTASRAIRTGHAPGIDPEFLEPEIQGMDFSGPEDRFRRDVFVKRADPDGMDEFEIFFRLDPELETINESYQIKIQRVLLDAEEQSLKLKGRHIELDNKLKELSGSYAIDKPLESASLKEIFSAVREIIDIQKELRVIRKDTMKKIQALNEEREEKVLSEENLWLDKIRNNEKELRILANLMEGPGMLR